MNAICRTYDDIADAQRAVEAVLAAGVPGDDVRLLMGAPKHDARRHAAPHGSFAGDGVSGGEGSFGDADRDVVVGYSDGREHSRVAGHRSLERLLVDAGLDADAAESDVRALHDGRVLVLVTTEAAAAARAADLMDAAAA